MIMRQIFYRFIGKISEKMKLSKQQWKAVNAILLCRTPALGGEVKQCEHCGKTEIEYRSCRNRHCPVCQAEQAHKWLEKEKKKLLPVSYFHVVFTFAAELNEVFAYNKKLLYGRLFTISAETMQTFFRDPKYIGALGGFLSILHTWGQCMPYHPHIHMIVPNGAVDPQGNWVLPRKNKHAKKFLFPVKALSLVFRGKLLQALERLYRKGKLTFPSQQAHDAFPDTLRSAARKRWQVYAKRPFAGPEQVLNYLARYTHRVAISEQRILSMQKDTVTFSYKDYRDHARRKTMTLEGTEFIRRFLQHVLPPHFRKIRTYGWQQGAQLKQKLPKLREWFAKQAQFAHCLSALLQRLEAPAKDYIPHCKHCKIGELYVIEEILPQRGSPTKLSYG